MDSINPSPHITRDPDPAPHPVTGSTPTPARLKAWIKHHRKALIVAISALLLISGSALAWVLTRPSDSTPAASTAHTPTPSPTPAPTPVTKASPLTGVQIAPELATRPIVSVMIENHPDARPQSGLQDAGVVYEALAEGGITRFQAFFLENQPKSLGPVRSLRPYYVDWTREYNAPVAHAGGSADALNLVGPAGVTSLNALVIGAPTFYRTTTRYAPHNLYTSSALLDALLTKRNLNKPAAFAPTPRKADAPASTAAHPKIHIEYSYTGYQVDYAYDPATNDYVRSLAGRLHADANTGQPIHVKNVVVAYTSVVASGDDKNHVNITTIGRGQGVVFMDGNAIPCTWVKDSRAARTKLLDASGKEIALNAGNTWYSIVPIGKTVTY